MKKYSIIIYKDMLTDEIIKKIDTDNLTEDLQKYLDVNEVVNHSHSSLSLPHRKEVNDDDE